MADTTARALRLLSLLQHHRFWPGAELADRLEVSERTVRRDVDRLRALGYPVEARRGAVGGYQLAAGAAMPPLLLDDDEAVALAVGLHGAGTGAIAGIDEAALRALAKLSQVLPAPLRARVDALAAVAAPPWDADVAVAPEVLRSLAEACRDEVRASFAYVDRAEARTDRYVEPHHLVVLGRRWYLVGHDADRDDWRTFRLDRISSVRLTRGRFARRTLPGGDPVAFVQARVRRADAGHDVEVVLRAPASSVGASWQRWATVTPLDATSCRLTMIAADLDWALFLLGGLGADFDVVAPAALRERLADWSARFGRAAAGEPPLSGDAARPRRGGGA